MPPPDSARDWVDGVVLTINRPSGVVRWALGLAAAMTVLGVATAFLVKVDRAVEGMAVVRPEGGTWTAQAPFRGKIVEILAGEGVIVKEGDPLYRMNTQDREIQRDGLRKLQGLAQQNLDGHLRRLPEAKIRGEVREQDAQAQARRQRALRDHAKFSADQAKREHELEVDLLKGGTSYPRKVEEAKATWDKAVEDLKVAEEEVLVSEHRIELARTEAGQDVEQIDAAVRDARRQVAQYAHEIEEMERQIREGTLRAARPGRVMRKIVVAPAEVEAGMPLAEIVPLDAKPMAEVRLDAADVADVNAGQKARVRFLGRTDPVLGEVQRVGADAEVENGRSSYRAEIALDPSTDRLPFGLQGRATIVTARATPAQLAWEWLLE